mmetsp:Transcript_60625/g.149075  ORF Transcript_60625/g.149075 Transcript_60625/m.149075 type:complete len:260 (+) Transcript_60625:1362-2141(+)
MRLHDGGENGGLLLVGEDGVEEVLARGEDEGVAADDGELLLHALHVCDGHLELLAHARVAAHGRHAQPAAREGAGGERDAAAVAEALHEHLPARASLLLAADDARHGDEDALSLDGPVHERGAEGVVAGAGHEAGHALGGELVGLLGDEGHGDALLALGHEAVRVAELEREADDGGDGREGDVALVARHAHAEHAILHAHDALVTHRRRVRAVGGAGEAKAGDVDAAGEAGEVEVLLRLGAVVHEELTGPERIGHHHGH